MMKFAAICVVVLASVLLKANAFEETYEFENAVAKEKESTWIWRSNAIGLKALHVNSSMGGNISVHLSLCLKKGDEGNKDIAVSIENVRYSNDGDNDDLRFELDKKFLANFTTSGDSKEGNNWNEYRDSNMIGSPVELKPGKRELVIFITTDSYGAELDSIRMRFENQDATKAVFCGSSLQFEE